MKQANDRLKKSGVPVDLLLITSEEDVYTKEAAEAAYQSVTLVPDVGDLAERGLSRLTQRIKEAYKI